MLIRSKCISQILLKIETMLCLYHDNEQKVLEKNCRILFQKNKWISNILDLENQKSVHVYESYN